jgi:hypothetical protein
MLTVPPAAFLGITISDLVAPAVITAAAGVLLAFLRGFAYVITGKRERERALYGDAYRAVMAWRQMLYRVRTRAPETEHKLLKRFDKLQVRIDFYSGWTASEGKSIGRSYARFVDVVQARTSPLVDKAWRMTDEERLPWNPQLDCEGHPLTDAASDLFLADVRSHLSLWVFPKLAVLWRNSRIGMAWRDSRSPKLSPRRRVD